MNKYITIFLCCLAMKIDVFAQSNYEAGYIITTKSDTISGFLERTDEIKLSKTINFKTDLAQTNSIQYGPEDIFGFGFRKDKIQFELVSVEIRKVNKVSKDLRFAKRLLEGYINLYKIQIPEKERLVIFLRNNTYVYVIKKDAAYLTLGQYEYERNNAVGINKQYIDVLNAAFSDCQKVLKLINKELEFDDKPILHILREYNTCKNPEAKSIDHVYEVKPVVKHGVELSYATYLSSTDETVKNSAGYSIGYFWDILEPDINRRHSFRFGLNYLNLRHTDKSINPPKKVLMHSIRIPLTGQVNFTKAQNAKIVPFFNFGLTGQFVKYDNLNYLDFVPWVHLAAGTYINKMRFSVQMESLGFGIKSLKIIAFSAGFRLDKNKQN